MAESSSQIYSKAKVGTKFSDLARKPSGRINELRHMSDSDEFTATIMNDLLTSNLSETNENMENGNPAEEPAKDENVTANLSTESVRDEEPQQPLPISGGHLFQARPNLKNLIHPPDKKQRIISRKLTSPEYDSDLPFLKEIELASERSREVDIDENDERTLPDKANESIDGSTINMTKIDNGLASLKLSDSKHDSKSFTEDQIKSEKDVETKNDMSEMKMSLDRDSNSKQDNTSSLAKNVNVKNFKPQQLTNPDHDFQLLNGERITIKKSAEAKTDNRKIKSVLVAKNKANNDDCTYNLTDKETDLEFTVDLPRDPEEAEEIRRMFDQYIRVAKKKINNSSPRKLYSADEMGQLPASERQALNEDAYINWTDRKNKERTVNSKLNARQQKLEEKKCLVHKVKLSSKLVVAEYIKLKSLESVKTKTWEQKCYENHQQWLDNCFKRRFKIESFVWPVGESLD
ncbi:hypothetical protein HELRODRAFT_170506 [Helobdella robusta]|uniref:Uncharacterized protein n=1 Tax=Helobdella robusta TaxID=6412 RepID=T1F352_HELRO|nr:hypothetical protein HELRODRAFT_170506 [Helobdella robusta]ESO07195.1 hypothetical protein HELRODRAFT_170506 [Helobdella robusta]